MALRVGLVGPGPIGNRHAQSYKDDPLAELVGICDIDRRRADEAAQRFGCRPYYRLQDMLDAEPDLDVVDVSTGGAENGGWHFEPTMQALAAGKHVLAEKPLSNSIVEAREMVAEAERRGVYLGCNLNHHFTPPAELGRRYIDEGKIGELVYCMHRVGFHGGEANYQPPSSPKVAGYPYFHAKAFLSHPFAVMRHFCGDVIHVQAFFSRPGFRRRVGDVMLTTLSIHVRFANDAAGYLLCQRGDASQGLGGWWSLEVGGTRGTFCIENCIEKITYWPAPRPGGPGKPENDAPGTPGGPEVTESGTVAFERTFANRIHAFLEDVTNGVPRDRLRASGRDALIAQECTWAAIESYEQGGVLVRPHPGLPPHG